ncbi:MAG: DUF4058 family protein [Caldilineaceae bacterium]|nr:DUF4058 family protein [Caldilineaceae bacterium]MCB0189561.1 DUF4058 family protein [Caldilineaceae bacterium]
MTDYPFPGMNPYLEQSSLWPNVHLGLINAIQVDLTPKIVPRYYVTAEERTYVAAIEPDTFAGRADVAVLHPQSTATPPPAATHTPAHEERGERHSALWPVRQDSVRQPTGNVWRVDVPLPATVPCGCHVPRSDGPVPY